MAFEPLVKPQAEPEPDPAAAPAAPNYEAQFAELKLDFERRINEAYRANKGLAPQVQYVPYPVQPQAAELTEDDATILSDIPGYVQKQADRIAAQREAQLREEFGTHLSAIYEKNFERDLKDLQAHPHFRFVGDDLKDFVTQNPAVKFEAGALQRKFNELVGSKIDEIQAAASAGETAHGNEVTRPRAVDHKVPVATSPISGRKAPKAEPVQLDEERESVRQFYNRQFGLQMSPEEWVEIESGKLLPRDGAGNMPRGAADAMREAQDAD